jgi:hypothetical protein
MLKDIINATDIAGKDVFRKSFESTVATFDPDTRLHTKRYAFEHSPVVDLHGKRFLACVKRGTDALLVETDSELKNLVVVAVMDTSIYSDALAEGVAQIKHHLSAKRPRKPAQKKVKAVK